MFSPIYQRYALIALTTVYTLSFMDRVIVGMLMQPIKEDLGLSDTQLGFLTGIAFALFYATMGIPIARWADRGNRVNIISLAIAMWGGMVMLCGFVTNFVQMVLVRIGAAVGEAGVMPPAYSLIGDYFPVNERTRAFSIYMSGISISIVISFVFAGWINETHGWRAAFLLIGLPGLLIALVAKFTLKEPRGYAGSQTPAERAPQQPKLREVFTILWQQRTLRYLILALVLSNFVGIGLGQWLPSFYIRNYGMATAELGIWMGLIGGLSGVVGTFWGGRLLDRYLAHNPRVQVQCIAAGMVLFVPVYWWLLFSSSQTIALCLLIPLNVVGLFFYGPLMGLIQRLVVDRMRAMAIAVTLFALNFVGMGLGPQVVGLLSDIMAPLLGVSEALRVAMASAVVIALVSAYCFWLAAREVETDLQVVNEAAQHGTKEFEYQWGGESNC